VKRSVPLKASPDKIRAFQQRARTNSTYKPHAISPASRAQRAMVRGKPCLVCGEDRGVDPAHLIDRSLLSDGQDDPRAVVPLCRATCHPAYDEHRLSLLERLETGERVELAFAVQRFGLLRTLERVTGERYRPVDFEAVS